MSNVQPMKRSLVYVGIHGCVVALDQESGQIAWSAELHKGGSFVPVIVEGSRVFATSGGEATCLDAETGALLWHNPLKGFGVGYAMLAGATNQGVAPSAADSDSAVAAAAPAS